MNWLRKLGWGVLFCLTAHIARSDIHDRKELPIFRTGAQPRDYNYGGHIGVFGGVNFSQSGDLDVSTPLLPGATATLKTKDAFGGVAGIKGGYTWPGFGKGAGFSDPGPDSLDGSFAVLPSLDYEFFWTGYKYKAQQNFFGVNTELTADVNAYVFSFDPTLKFQIGMFRPYIGFGIGVAYLNADNGSVSGSGIGSTNLIGSADDWVLALQGLAGVELFIAKNWALSIDYKYLNFHDVNLNSTDSNSSGSIPLTYKADDIGQHIVTSGIHFYF